jgi:hypothetical protein
MSKSVYRTATLALSALILIGSTAHQLASAQEGEGLGSEHLCGDNVNSPVVSLGQATAEFFPSFEVALKPGAGEDLQLVMPFNRERGYRTESFKLEFVEATRPQDEEFPPGTPLILDVSVIKRDTDGMEANPEKHIVYYALSTLRGVEAKLCFLADGIPPGRYQGTVQIKNFNITHTPIPLVVTVQENNIVLMLGLAAVGIIGGTIVLYLQAQSTKVSAGGDRDRFWKWFGLNWIGLFLGTGVIYGIWQASFIEVDSFGSAGTDYVTFAIACGTAFTTAAVAGSLGQMAFQNRGSDNSPPKGAVVGGNDYE